MRRAVALQRLIAFSTVRRSVRARGVRQRYESPAPENGYPSCNGQTVAC
ncbi:hypothetical protein CSUI_008406 [Cystoisospora suis]|uniref:Uncharacterized protein n=1 Tax=Cystoisospora suis TaxID=483139 RepID=A0A2C6KN09_9APIC|nr:hypothetical protein CSUI_008406 [Cystoisospora suis]